MKPNALNWFEIHAADFARARNFYETILDANLDVAEGASCPMAIFPYNTEKGIGGSICQMDGYKPGPGGTVVYLNVEGGLDTVIARIPVAGGKIIRERTAIPPHGFIALFEDSEGNVVGLHSMS